MEWSFLHKLLTDHWEVLTDHFSGLLTEVANQIGNNYIQVAFFPWDLTVFKNYCLTHSWGYGDSDFKNMPLHLNNYVCQKMGVDLVHHSLIFNLWYSMCVCVFACISSHERNYVTNQLEILPLQSSQYNVHCIAQML